MLVKTTTGTNEFFMKTPLENILPRRVSGNDPGTL
jgi:hypothetical protein